MQLKSRQVLLYLASCCILYASDLPGGSLLALAALLQLTILIKGFPFTKQSQWAFFKLFLFSVPLFFFWGGAHSFINIYLHEGALLMALAALLISLGLSFLVSFQLIFAMSYLPQSEFGVNAAIQTAFNEIRAHRSDLFKTTGLVFIFSLVPYLHEDWKLVFAITATLAYLNQSQLKQAFSKT